MFERFTDRARMCFQEGNKVALRLQHSWLGVEHVVYGLTKMGGSLANMALTQAGIFPGDVERFLTSRVGVGDDIVMGKLPLTPRLKQLVEQARQKARDLDDNYVGSSHLLLAALDQEDSPWVDLLNELGNRTAADLRVELLELMDGHVRAGQEQADAAAQARCRGMVEAIQAAVTALAAAGPLTFLEGKDELLRQLHYAEHLHFLSCYQYAPEVELQISRLEPVVAALTQ